MAPGPRDDAGTLTTSYAGAEQPGQAADPPPLRERIGRYLVEEQLGQGGMGVVFAARDPELARAVALKVVRPGVGDRPYRKRLVREARAMAKLEHPNVVRVYDAGEVDGEVFVAMELVRGETLGRWLRAERRPWREVIARFVAAGRGLAAAHHAGLVHRDFKPDNVLVRASDGRVCVTDFGLAIPAGSEGAEPEAVTEPPIAAPPGGATDALASSGLTALTRTGTAVGTPAYMAPEQRRGEEVDARADVFSFCVSLYEGVYGVRPFDPGAIHAEGSAATAPGSRADRERSPAVATRGVPGAVRRAIARGLSSDPAARWPAIDPLLDVLERATRRRSLAISLAVVGVAAVAVLAALAIGRIRAPVVAGSPPGGPPWTLDRATRVTFALGCEAQPAFLPDGKLVYVQRTGVATTLRIGPEGDAGQALGAGGSPAISPGGRYLAALDRTAVTIRDLQHPSEPPRARGTSTGALAWLDDRELVVGVENKVVARPIDGGDDRVLAELPAGSTLRVAAVGANGRMFGIHRAEIAVAEDFLVEILPASGKTRDIRRGLYWQGGLRYLAATNMIYFVQRMNSTQYHLFRVGADATGDPQALVSDTPPTGGFDVTPDGHRLAFSSCVESATLVKIPRSGRLTDLMQRGNWRDSAPAIIDANRFVYTSTRGGLIQLWLHDGPGKPDRPLTEPESSYPVVSPDHKTLVYAAYNAQGTDTLAVRPLDAPQPAHDATTGHLDRAPRFTRDGTTLVFVRDTPAGIRLSRVAVTGGAVSEVVSEDVRVFDVSPIDDTIAYVTPGRERDKLRMIAPGGGAVRDAPGAAALPPRPRFVRFAPDGATIAVVDRDGIVELDLATGTVRPRWKLEGTPYLSIPAIDFDADGSSLVAGLVASDGDVWIAEGQF